MALRVLLADESVTIKKAFELALQDYGVDIVSVNAGVDVVPVAMKFKPDIIFADVLLQKKNGYDLSQELKSLDETKKIPVVLIWSGFMELDQAKFQKSKANDQLEKPFDTDRLRMLVQKLVPRLSSQSLSPYLDFPSMPEMDEAPPADIPEPTMAGVPMPHQPETENDSVIQLGGTMEPSKPQQEEETYQYRENSWSMDQFESMQTPEDDSDDFMEMPLQTEPPEVPQTKTSKVSLDEDEESPWVSQTITQFKMDKKKLAEPDEISFEVPEDRIDPDTLVTNRDLMTSWSGIKAEEAPPPISEQSENTSVETDDLGLELDLNEETSGSVKTHQVSERQIELMVKAQAREIIEKVIWEVVPEIATQIIEREIKKLLNEKFDNEK